MLNRLAAFTALLAIAAPGVAHAKPIGTFEWLIVAPGDQTKPSIDGSYVVYADHSGADWNVLLYDLGKAQVFPVADGPQDEDSPDVSGGFIAYRTPNGIRLYSIELGKTLRAGAEPGLAGGPAMSDAVAAWEQGTPGSRDIAWFRFLPLNAPEQKLLALPGDQHAPAVFGFWVAYVDDAAGGAVRVVNVTTNETATLCEGDATGISLDASPSAQFRAAVARTAPGGDPDIELYELGAGLQKALRVPGEQRNPHLSGDWVAFEDLSTGRSQIVLWNHVTGVAYVPHPSGSDQLLNDLSVASDGEVRVVFADNAHGDLDIALYRLPLPFEDDGTPLDWPPAAPPPLPAPARCDDPAAVLLAELTLTRDDGKKWWAGRTTFLVATAANVLVCIDAERVWGAWVALDDEVVASPCDFKKTITHLERRAAVEAGQASVSAVFAGKRGAFLRVRVLAPAVPVATPGVPPNPRPPSGGCSNAGAGLGPLTALGLLALRRRRAART